MNDRKSDLSRRNLIAGAMAGAALAALPRTALADDVLRRPIPHTGEMLPVIGIGTAIVFDIKDDAAKRAERAEVIKTLVAGGGSMIDTASTYGAAESVVGDLLAETGLRSKVFLGTKVELRGRDDQIAEMRRSQQLLRSEKIDLMHLHNVRDPNQDLGLLREWKAQGRFRYIGITTTFPRDYAAAEAVLKREKPDFFEVNYSLADREAEQRLLPLAKEVGAAVLTALPFGRGNLFRLVRDKSLPDWAAEFDAASWGQFFLKFLLSNDAITAVIPGTDKPEYMTDNLKAGRGRLPDAAMRQRMIAFIDSLR
jgi:aryl-alcohol dehydrogenase-like predicted oxidoreductase